MKEEWKVYINGVPGRGKEVIKVLTDLVGGTVTLEGSNTDCIYFIDHDGTIDFEYLTSEQAQIIMDNYKEIKLAEPWEDGDILFSENNNEFAVFAKYPTDPDKFFSYIAILPWHQYYVTYQVIDKKDFRIATKKEVAQFYERLHSNGKDWDAEKKKLVDWKWKPKDSENYWTIIVGITIYKLKLTWIGSEADKIRYELGNCFRTCDEADTMLKKVKLLFNKE